MVGIVAAHPHAAWPAREPPHSTGGAPAVASHRCGAHHAAPPPPWSGTRPLHLPQLRLPRLTELCIRSSHRDWGARTSAAASPAFALIGLGPQCDLPLLRWVGAYVVASLILRRASVRSGGLLDLCSLPLFSVWSNLPRPLRGVHVAVDTRSLGATRAGVHLPVSDASSTSTAVTLRRGQMG